MKNLTEKKVFEFFETFGTDKDWKSLLADDINFTSPMDEVDDKDKFIELDTQFRQLVKKASVKWIITNDEQASALVNYDMALPTGDSLNITFSEIINLDNQKIKSIEVFFDTAKFYEFLSKMETK
ncbi:nuclear transport factor 2 family protein [Flavivirga eckloniae]|uniref:SnoaL-like domain-containing protein n=1 Tax=Flavivirga eckloniae TaxID=1803846 RepID=A0A2K9PXM6_9FLAO|nr:nuclear transport factor 2 family protein [Flavivirga eckloniae]AUP81297.1 hypothetical protein C1H87_22285 [Flavivirga eckloniae]